MGEWDVCVLYSPANVGDTSTGNGRLASDCRRLWTELHRLLATEAALCRLVARHHDKSRYGDPDNSPRNLRSFRFACVTCTKRELGSESATSLRLAAKTAAF